MRDASERDVIEADGVVRDLSHGLYTVDCATVPQPVRARLGGKLNLYRIRVLVGDRVRVEVSPYDLTRGRITRRL
jgi:translation initiation factor IF-1